MPRGQFITFEGGEGVGKSTQIALLASHLEALGREVVVLREPGSTAIGERIREILLDPAHGEMDPHAELLLYEAARAQMVNQVVLPAIAEGKVVLCDRFNDSTVAYQGYARGLGVALVKQVDDVATGGLAPDATVLLCRDTDAALEAARAGGADRLESEPDEFHAKVREAFDVIAAAEPERVVRIVVTGGIEETFAEMLARLGEVLGWSGEDR